MKELKNSKKILIAEDEENLAILLEYNLTKEGYKTQIVVMVI